MKRLTTDLEDTYLLQPREVARIFNVDVKTVGRWARQGKLHPVPTPGGHSRYYLGEIRAVLAGKPLTPGQLQELRERAVRKAMQS